MSYFQNYFISLSLQVNSIDPIKLEKASKLIQSISKKNGKIIIAGNGGSSSIASHVSVDLTKNANIRSVNFNEADLITCFANDYGYERWIEKALVSYADSEDLVILISSSGTSKNIINGGKKAKELGLKIITLSGFDANNPLRELGDYNFWLDSNIYNIVELTHSIWLLAIVDHIIENM
ncbi:MAG: SIS domain-containing protein [Deltaproteobacteria bacterium]|nr:SIS domain-containing protein [Deltaproteobacteria bacterium]